MYYPHHYGYGFSLFRGVPFGGYITMGLGILIAAALIYLLVKKSGSFPGQEKSDSPLEILQKRFVNGEISREEYLEKKEILKK